MIRSAVENVELDGRTHPLAADFTAPLALALADQNHRRKELSGLFRPADFESRARLARLQPYDPKKIPVLCIHGLGDSQATWAPLIQTLRGDAAIRKNYQFWFFSYPTGFPYPFAASVLRRRLDAITAHYPDHRKIVVIGHSMGGMIGRTLITDSGMNLWNALYDKSPAEMPFSAETLGVMTDSLIFQPRPEIARVIFASASHRGSDVATGMLGRLGSRIIGAPAISCMRPTNPRCLPCLRPNSTGANLRRMPNSIDFLKPNNRFVTTLAELPLPRQSPTIRSSATAAGAAISVACPRSAPTASCRIGAATSRARGAKSSSPAITGRTSTRWASPRSSGSSGNT